MELHFQDISGYGAVYYPQSQRSTLSQVFISVSDLLETRVHHFFNNVHYNDYELTITRYITNINNVEKSHQK